MNGESFPGWSAQLQAINEAFAERERALASRCDSLQSQFESLTEAASEAKAREQQAVADCARIMREHMVDLQHERELADLARQDILDQLHSSQLLREQFATKLELIQREALQTVHELGKQHQSERSEALERELRHRRESNELQLELRRRFEAVNEAHGALEQMRATLQQARIELAQTHSSLSWRITAPLRRLGGSVSAASAPSVFGPESTHVATKSPEAPPCGGDPVSFSMDDAMTNNNQGPRVVQHADQLLVLYDEAFVRSAYLNVLGRQPDPAGLASFLLQTRKGVDREQLIAALALSDEGRALPMERLPGLRDLLQRAQRNRPSIFRRAIRRLNTISNGPIFNRLEALEHQVIALTSQTRLQLHHAEKTLANAYSIPADESIIDAEREGFAGMSSHARKVYLQLREASERYKRVNPK
jgi:hypothetical protein